MFLRRSNLYQHLSNGFEFAPTVVAGRSALEKENVMSLKLLAEKIRNWQRNRESVRELSKLSDRELADLGINRVDIEFVVKNGLRHA